MSVNTVDESSTTGVVELREDIPLKPSGQHGGASRYFTGIRFIVICFSVLTAAITVALATQIYFGDYELVPHGSVASDEAACSRIGTNALKAGGGALDAAVASALCLAVLSPHHTGLDAGPDAGGFKYSSGSEYRTSPAQRKRRKPLILAYSTPRRRGQCLFPPASSVAMFGSPLPIMGGTLMLYYYRKARAQGPLVADWSRAPSAADSTLRVKRTGDTAPLAGDAVPRAGDTAQLAGDDAPRAGDTAQLFGENATRAGDAAQSAGDAVLLAGDAMQLAGVAAPLAGDTVPRAGENAPRAPRLLAALAALHRRYGKLPWEQLVAPAAKLARGFPVSASLAAATQRPGMLTSIGVVEADDKLELSSLATYLEDVAAKTDEELATLAASVPLSMKQAMRAEFGGHVLFYPPAQPAAVALVAALRQLLSFGTDAALPDDQLTFRVAGSLQQALRAGGGGGGGGGGAGGVATNVAIMDKDDVYASLVTGMASPFGSRTMAPQGYFPDVTAPGAAPALTPIMLTENFTCGYRSVLGSGDVSALAHVSARLLAGERDLILSIELPRFAILPDSSIGIQVQHARQFAEAELKELRSVGALRNLTAPYPSCNVVQQKGDALSSHSDSRGGGIASRF